MSPPVAPLPPCPPLLPSPTPPVPPVRFLAPLHPSPTPPPVRSLALEEGGLNLLQALPLGLHDEGLGEEGGRQAHEREEGVEDPRAHGLQQREEGQAQDAVEDLQWEEGVAWGTTLVPSISLLAIEEKGTSVYTSMQKGMQHSPCTR